MALESSSRFIQSIPMASFRSLLFPVKPLTPFRWPRFAPLLALVEIASMPFHRTNAVAWWTATVRNGYDPRLVSVDVMTVRRTELEIDGCRHNIFGS